MHTPETKLLNNFVKFVGKELGISSLPTIKFVGAKQNRHNSFGYSHGDEIVIRITERHPIDIMRTIAHEMIHYKQNIKGIKGLQYREDEANALAGRLMKKYGVSNGHVFYNKPIGNITETESAIPANVMGASSSTHGTGGIDTYDPLMPATKFLKKKKKKIKEEIDRERMLADRVKTMQKESGKGKTSVNQNQPNPLKNSIGNKSTAARDTDNERMDGYDTTDHSLKLGKVSIKSSNEIGNGKKPLRSLIARQ
jgi:hypothetical protein